MAVHSAGQAGDLLYYTMPLVEGESLRARLARDGALPASEAVRILSDVVDALAYAHSRGVVHRDIKPDNVLIFRNHAMVTDFGVAKAMSDASGTSALTLLGVSLGTPAYMSPEQVAADPNADHRADLYAVGAMAYEMLCGHAPFAGLPPQQVLAAHIMTTPPPLVSQRADVPAAVSAIVMRCLEKKPEDRFQSADDLQAQLQSLATPTGGMMPTIATAPPGFSSGEEAAIRRAHPARVVMLFVAVSIAVLAIVFVLRQKLGLPDWVLGGAAALLAIGLPIMLMTGRKERERVIAAATGTYRVPDAGVQKHLTWRTALVGGGLSFAALAVLVIGYTVMRVLGIGSIGTLQAKGLIKERQPILLAEFVNRTPDSTLASTLTDAFRVDLAQSQSVKLMDGQAVSDALKRMQKPENAGMTVDLARELAQREGVPAVVAGEINAVGKSYVLSAKVLSASNGSVLTALRETAANDAELIPALDRLSRALRERIGESLVSIRADEPLEHVTTGSLDALRKYSQAWRLANTGQEEAAIPLLQSATTIDTGFAMAWRKLSVLILNNGGSVAEGVEAARRAYAHRDRLPELEKLAAIGTYYNTVDNDQSKVMAAYRAMLAIDPDNGIAQNNLALELVNSRHYKEGESLAVACVKRGDSTRCPLLALRAELLQGKLTPAESTLAQWGRKSPDDPEMLQSRVEVASWRGDYGEAEKLARALGSAMTSSRQYETLADADLASLAFIQGKIAEAERLLRASAALQEAGHANTQYLLDMTGLAVFDLSYRNRPAEAMSIVSDALAKHSLASMDAVDRPYSTLAIAYAMAGNVEEAQRLMAEYQHAVRPEILKGDRERFNAAGHIAFARGHYAEAIDDFERSRDGYFCQGCANFDIAQAFRKARQPDSALTYFESYIAAGDVNRIFEDAQNLAATYQQLGELYEAKGDRRRAIDAYQKMLGLWKNADPELQPIIKDVKQRVARLQATRT